MKQYARVLIECGIQSVDVRPEDSYAVGSAVLKAFRNKRFKKQEQLGSVVFPTHLHALANYL